MKRLVLISLAVSFALVLGSPIQGPPPDWNTVTAHGYVRLQSHEGPGVANVQIDFTAGGVPADMSVSDANGYYLVSHDLPPNHIETMWVIPNNWGRTGPYTFVPEDYHWVHYASAGSQDMEIDFIAYAKSLLPLVMRSEEGEAQP